MHPKVPPGEANERLLVEAAQKDPTRFAELYEANFERVYAFVAHRVRNRADTEDLTSAVFHKALENLPRFKWRGVPFAAWLFRIAGNMIADRAKHAARENSIVPDDETPDLTETSIEEVEKSVRLFGLVQQLPADQRRVIVLRFAEEKSIREIAREMGRSEGAIKQLQLRGLQNLRTSIGATDG